VLALAIDEVRGWGMGLMCGWGATDLQGEVSEEEEDGKIGASAANKERLADVLQFLSAGSAVS
jgi:hypothetical protein